MTNQQAAPEALADPSPDQLRAIARSARNSSGSASDDCGPPAYVLHGWRAAAIAFRAQQATLVDAQQPATHVQDQAEIEHVAGDVSKNAPESDMAQQPSPSVASKAVLAAIRAANMQLVRTGDDEFMLVTFKQATPQADSAQDKPLQAFDSPRARALMRAWEEGWAACRDAEYVGEEAQNDAFNSSHTLTLCIAEDQQLPAPQADSQPAKVPTSATGGDWTQPTTVALRLGDAMQLLCGGKRPPDDMVQQWLDNTSESLQEFAASNGPAWAQGIGLIDAALVMVDQPTEIRTIDNPDRDHEHRAARKQGGA